MKSETQEIIDAAFTAVRGVTERFNRAWYLNAGERGIDPIDQWMAMAEQGLLGLGVPQEYGGLGGGITGPVAVMEAMSEAGTPCYAYILTAFCIKSILKGGTDAQKRRWVPRAVSGDWRCCFAITEPTAGTNTFNIRTRATRMQGGYRISGEKVFTSCANVSDSMVIVARTNEGPRADLSLFVVDLPCKGITMQQLDIEMYGPEKQFAVFFDDVEVTDDQRLGAEAAGKDILFHALNPERFLISAWSLGLGNLSIKKGADYARTRAPFGKPIGSYQAVAHPLAHAKMNLDAARLMLYAGCEEYDAGGLAGLKANMAKYLASTAALQAIEAAIQLHGGHAWDKRTDLVQIWPMIRLMSQSPINNQMLLNYVAEHVLGLPKSY
jgi:acyl-CoA dehydrogenase